MNKKELVKLLFQHDNIRTLIESGHFDASTLKRVISEEIMREAEEESGFTDLETVQARENEAEMKELQVSLNLAQDHLKAFQTDYLKAKERFTQAKVDGDRATQSSERGEMAQAKTFKKEEQERIDKIEAQIAYLKSLGVAASKTQTPEDDEYVDMAVDTVAQNIKDATDMIDAAENEAELAGLSRAVAQNNSGELEAAQKAVKAAVAKDKEQSNNAPPSEMPEPTSEFTDEEINTAAQKLLDDKDSENHDQMLGFLQQQVDKGEENGAVNQTSSILASLLDPDKSRLGVTGRDELGGEIYDHALLTQLSSKILNAYGDDASEEADINTQDTQDTQDEGRPWGDARKAARAKVTSDTTPEDIQKALNSPQEFIAFFNPRGEQVGAKMKQIEQLFNDEFFEQEIAKIRAKADEATDAPEAEKSEKTQIVIDDAADLMGTYVAFDQYLEELPDTYEMQAVSDAVRNFLPTSTPKSAEEFESDFLEPIDNEITGGEGTDTDADFDFSQKREQLVKRAESTLPYLGVEDDAILDNKPFMIFMGTVLEKEGLISEEEETAQSYVDKYIPQIENEETRKEYFLTPEEAGELVQFLQTNKEEVDGIIAKAIKGSTEDFKSAAKDVIENTPEVEPDADGDSSPLATEEMDAAWTTTLDVFFGKSREKSSFMRQFLLKNQASMLYGMIDVLGQIITGGAGGEERSLSREKTQVKRKEEPVAPPAEDEKKEEPPKTDTTTPDTSADDEEADTTASVVGESLEEQVINEIFGMFGGKDNEDKEIKFSPKSTSLMRQDLEAMVDLLRSLKTDIGQYKKYSTSSSVDPRFDGSTLKRAMDAKLKVVQQSIAHLTKVIDIEVQSQQDQLKADGAQAGQDSVDLQEASGSDRKVRIDEVEKVYNEMRRQYLKGLKVSLSTNNAEEAKAGAKELKDYVMGQETFMSYFPSNIITSSGGVMTLGSAHESMVAIIAPFIETIRDIVTITKTQKVSESNLQQAIGNLVMISDSIESMFKVPSLIDREFMKKYIEAAKQNPENQPLTDEEPEMMDKLGGLAAKAGELGGKALEKLKQMFSWMSDETRKLLLKFFGEDSELIVGLSNLDLSEEQKEVLVEEVMESKTWYESLEQNDKSAVDALVKYLINAVGRDSLKQLNYPAVVSEKLDGDERRRISRFAQETAETFGKELSSRTYRFLYSADEETKNSSMKLMIEKTDELVSYLTTIFKIVEKISEKAAEDMLDSSQRNASNDQAGADKETDKTGSLEDEVPTAPDDLDKDNSEPEDEELPGMDDPDKETDKTGSPEDEEDIADFNREVKSVDEFLPFPSRPTIPIAKEIQPIKDSFVKLSAKNKNIPAKKANALFNKFFLLIFKQMNKDLMMERDVSTSFNIPKIKQDVKTFITSLKSEDLKLRDFNRFFENIETEELVKLLSLIKKRKQQIAKAIYGEKGVANQTNQGSSEKAVRGKEVNLEEALKPIIEKMLNEHYNH